MNNQKEGFKEVWHVWDGMGEPPKINDLGFVLLRKGLKFGGRNSFNWDVLNIDYDIVAYTTGQIRRRVECDLCKNTGLFCHEGLGCVVCPRCNGKGYQWEYKQCSS